MLAGLRAVFSRPRFLLLATGVGAAVLILATWLPNARLVWLIASSESISLADKAKVLVALVGSLGTNFTSFTALVAVVVASLFGANVAAITYYLRQRWRYSKLAGPTHATASVAGIVSGVVGLGCAACGTIILGPLLTSIGAGSVLGLMPFGGEEFSVLGIGLLAASLLSISKRIAQPDLCKIEPMGNKPSVPGS